MFEPSRRRSGTWGCASLGPGQGAHSSRLNPLIPLSAHDDATRSPAPRFDAILLFFLSSTPTLRAIQFEYRDPFQGICNAIPVCRQDPPRPAFVSFISRDALGTKIPTHLCARNCRLTLWYNVSEDPYPAGVLIEPYYKEKFGELGFLTRYIKKLGY